MLVYFSLTASRILPLLPFQNNNCEAFWPSGVVWQYFNYRFQWFLFIHVHFVWSNGPMFISSFNVLKASRGTYSIGIHPSSIIFLLWSLLEDGRSSFSSSLINRNTQVMIFFLYIKHSSQLGCQWGFYGKRNVSKAYDKTPKITNPLKPSYQWRWKVLYAT